MPDQPVVGDERGDWAGQALVVPICPWGWQQGGALAVRSSLSGFQNRMIQPLGKAVLGRDVGLAGRDGVLGAAEMLALAGAGGDGREWCLQEV